LVEACGNPQTDFMLIRIWVSATSKDHSDFMTRIVATFKNQIQYCW
jgi:hypothetical protein